MDEIVRAALKKWPNVPDCYGWLALDARGDWYMRDERIQARRAVPARQGQPHRAREAARVHRAQLRMRRAGLLVLPERAAARLRRARGGAAGVAPELVAAPRRGAGPHGRARPPSNRPGSTSTAACSCHRRRLRHRAHAGHGGRVATPSRRACGARDAGVRRDAGALRLRAQPEPASARRTEARRLLRNPADRHHLQEASPAPHARAS